MAESLIPDAAGPFDRSAALIDCDDPLAPAEDPGQDFVIVTVPLSVTSDGVVDDVGTPRSTRSRRSQQVLDRAVSLARTCVFEPAVQGGLTVPDRVDVQFRLSLRGES